MVAVFEGAAVGVFDPAGAEAVGAVRQRGTGSSGTGSSDPLGALPGPFAADTWAGITVVGEAGMG